MFSELKCKVNGAIIHMLGPSESKQNKNLLKFSFIQNETDQIFN